MLLYRQFSLQQFARSVRVASITIRARSIDAMPTGARTGASTARRAVDGTRGRSAARSNSPVPGTMRSHVASSAKSLGSDTRAIAGLNMDDAILRQSREIGPAASGSHDMQRVDG